MATSITPLEFADDRDVTIDTLSAITIDSELGDQAVTAVRADFQDHGVMAEVAGADGKSRLVLVPWANVRAVTQSG